jgi:DNA-binding NtrC family response regulator
MNPRFPSSPVVLVVAENLRLNEFLLNSLSRNGYQVLTADSCLSALSILSVHAAPQIDVLLTQHRTGLMKGVDLARWIHRFHPQLRCLILSNSEPSAQPFPCNCLPDPFDEPALLLSINHLLAPMAIAA